MANRRELIKYIRFQLQEELSADNGAHNFEHICREVARKRIASNVIPATGPVGGGGDAGRDFETFKSYLPKEIGEHGAFVALVSDKALAFACTLQKKNVDQKFKDDVKSIVDSGDAFEHIYAMCAVNFDVGRRNKLKRSVRQTYGLALTVFDGQWIADQLADPDLFWVAHTYLGVPADMAPPHSIGTSVVEDRSSDWSEPPKPKKYEAMQVSFGDYEDPESIRTLAEIVAEQRNLAAQGKQEEAFEALLALAIELHEWGLSEIALEVLDDLHEMVPPGNVAPADDAWVLNAEALARAHLGQTAEADVLWRRMLSIGERLDDRDLQAIALQNLATSDVNAGRLPEAKELVRRSLVLMEELGRTRSMVQLINNLALINIDSEQFEDATAQLDAYEEMAGAVGDVHLLVSAKGNRGRLFMRQGRLADAEEAFREALRLSRQTGSATKEVLSLQNMGAVCVDQQRYGDAMRWYRKGIRLAETFSMPVQVEVLQRSLGTALHEAGRNREAIIAYDRAREAAWQLGDRTLWALSTMNIGAMYALFGDGGAAIDPLSRAASTFRELGEFDQEVLARTNMAAAYKSDGQLEAASVVLEKTVPLLAADDHGGRSSLLRQAAEMCLGDSRLLVRAVELFERFEAEDEAYLAVNERAHNSAQAGIMLRNVGAVQEALAFLDRAVGVAAPGSPTEYGLADALVDRATVLARLGCEDDACSDLSRCIELAKQSGEQRLLHLGLANLAEIERRRGRTAQAVELARRAADGARQVEDVDGLAHALDNLGLAAEDDGRLDEAIAVWQELYALGESNDKARWQARALNGRARVAFIRCDYKEAADYYKKAVLVDGDTATGSDAVVFALGGQLESLSRAGAIAGLEEAAQQLVDAVESRKTPAEAITYFGRSAISWMQHGKTEEAVSMLVAAFQLGVQAAEAINASVDGSVESSEGFCPAFEALCLVVLTAREAGHGEGALYDEFTSQLDTIHAGLGESVSPLLEMARDAMERLD